MEQLELRTPVRTMLRTDMQDAVVEERVGRRIVGVKLSVSNDVAPQSTDKLSTLPRPFLSPTQDPMRVVRTLSGIPERATESTLSSGLQPRVAPGFQLHPLNATRRLLRPPDYPCRGC